MPSRWGWGRAGAAPLGRGRAHLSHFIGFGHTWSVCFLLCGMISAFLLLPGAEHSGGGWEHAMALGP